MPASFKVDPNARAKFAAGIRELASLMDREDPEGLRHLLRLSARRFVRNAVDITPPASGKADTAAKKAGENAIVADLLRLAQPVQGLSRKQAGETFMKAEQLLELQARSRSSGTGRVNPRNRKDRPFMLQQEFNKAAKVLMARVGWLAAGLNAAAEKLGFRLPAWIVRHGQKYGAIEVKFTLTRLLIRVVQNVPYTDRVGGYNRKWAFAFAREVRSIQKQVGVLRDKAFGRTRARLK